MYFIILAITVFINVTLVAVPQDRPVFVTEIVKGRKCGHAKKKECSLHCGLYIPAVCLASFTHADVRFIGLSFWEASSPLSSESILGTETSLKHPSQSIRHELEK